jgi:DTW domain-containing protein
LHTNSVLTLRQQELAQSTCEFRARGSKVVRCGQCILPKADCICAARPEAAGTSAFCFILYKGEAYKPSNTGRLIADVIVDNHAFLWSRTQPDSRLLALLNDEQYAPIIIFPHQYAEAARCIHYPNEVPTVRSGKKPLFIMLDGTWREAKKMFKSPYLSTLPVLGVQPEKASTYLLREAAHLHQLCTVEVGIEVLRLAGDNALAEALAEYFGVFCKNYMVLKPHLLEKIREASD